MLEKLEWYAHNVPTGHCTYSVTGFSWMVFCTFVDQTFPKAVQLNKKDICRLSCAGQELQKSILKQLLNYRTTADKIHSTVYIYTHHLHNYLFCNYSEVQMFQTTLQDVLRSSLKRSIETFV